MKTKSNTVKKSTPILENRKRFGNNKFIQGLIVFVGIGLYFFSRKSKVKIKHTFLLATICLFSFLSLSCSNKKQNKIDINKALDNAIEKVEHEADKLKNTLYETKKENRKGTDKIKHKIEKI